jgi:hypothetical protein
MSLPAQDQFTGANGTALTTYSANWALNLGDFAIHTNALRPNRAGDDAFAHWNADAFDNNQYAKIVVSAIANGVFIGPCVRAAASAETGYITYFDVDTVYFFKYVGGVYNDLASSASISPAVSDTLYLEANGTSILAKHNGSNLFGGAVTDSSIASGYAGVSGFSNNTTSRLDNWEGGNLGAAVSSIIAQVMFQYRQRRRFI